MKFTVLSFLLVLIAVRAPALPNPAAVYCEKLGYEYKRAPAGDGKNGEKGIAVVAPGVEFDAWDFFRGKVGNEYSFGALFGLDTKCVRTNISSCVLEYAVCAPKGKNGMKPGAQILLVEFMKQKGLPLFDGNAARGKKRTSGRFVPANREEDMLGIYEIMAEGKTLPASFDWRNYGGHAYIGAIRDQGSCGSCYSFAACAAAEGTYNFACGKYDGDCIDFSESFVIWCLGRLPKYNSHFYGCDGADYDYAELTALSTEGVCLESAFPYTESDPGSCAHWSDQRTSFSSWHWITCGDVEAVKTAIMTYGVVDAAVDAGSFSSYGGGIYDDAKTNCDATPCYYTDTDHAIALVGWDDDPPEGGGGCWILRNSWGTSWGESGYMRIRYNAAVVACEVCYLTYSATNTHTLTVTSAHGGANPPVGVATNNDGAALACCVTNSPLLNGTTRYVCTGWIGTGSVPVSGSGTNTGTFLLTNDSSIVWLWNTNFYLTLSINGNGSLDAVSGWKAAGTNMIVTATPTHTNAFISWGGDTGGCVVAGSRITVVMDRARAITANFTGGSQTGISSCVCADYDGDARADPAVYDEATGIWRIKLSSAGYYLLSTSFNGLGGPGYASVAADYDGDHKADPAVYAESSGVWKLLLSGANYSTVVVLGQTLGGPGYSGMPADYDGDTKADPGVYRRDQGDWKVLFSSAQYFPMEDFALLGGTGLRAVAADYDGDRKADPAVYGENSGIWAFKLSSAGYVTVAMVQSLGGTGWVPVPADYDGDGKTDPAVKSAAGSEWIVMFSTSGYTPSYLTIPFDSVN